MAFSEPILDEIKQIESELFEMEAKTVLLTISHETVEKRIKSRNPEEWIGKSAEEIKLACDLLLKQRELRRQARESIIPTIGVNTDNKDWDTYAKQIYFFN